ncbi:hypothetical protein [Luteimonas mephitis]|uniref:hypothetical protein n=1 Tax=Luteimonas mephitis TaxID=83615 RepID=UPI00047E53FD|nr:hypothetical protein [Luteimonas mephitis]
MKTLLMLAIIAAGGSAMAAEPVDSIPDQFIGEWNADVADCGIGRNDSILKIDANTISYWESVGFIQAIVVQGRREVALIADMSGEGEEWLATAHFKLSEAGDELVSMDERGGEFVRYRCPRSE